MHALRPFEALHAHEETGNCVLVGRNIPVPLVDLDAALREAKARVHALCTLPEVQAGWRSHGGAAPRLARGRSAAKLSQGVLF